jgi:hypothetical protein
MKTGQGICASPLDLDEQLGHCEATIHHGHVAQAQAVQAPQEQFLFRNPARTGGTPKDDPCSGHSPHQDSRERKRARPILIARLPKVIFQVGPVCQTYGAPIGPNHASPPPQTEVAAFLLTLIRKMLPHSPDHLQGNTGPPLSHPSFVHVKAG